MTPEDFVKWFVFIVLGVGILIYSFIIMEYLRGRSWVVSLLDKGGGEYTFGLPIAGMVTTAIVYVFGVASPGGDGKYTFRAFSLEFDGPAAPATIWIVVFLTFVASIRILRRRAGDAIGTQEDDTARAPLARQHG